MKVSLILLLWEMSNYPKKSKQGMGLASIQNYKCVRFQHFNCTVKAYQKRIKTKGSKEDTGTDRHSVKRGVRKMRLVY